MCLTDDLQKTISSESILFTQLKDSVLNTVATVLMGPDST